MNEKEKFEDIIASKFSEAEFPFDERNWDDAEEMISSFRKKEKRKRIGLVFGSGLLLGVILMLPFVIKINNNSNNLISEVARTPNVNTASPVLNEATPLENKIEQPQVQVGQKNITKILTQEGDARNDNNSLPTDLAPSKTSNNETLESTTLRNKTRKKNAPETQSVLNNPINSTQQKNKFDNQHKETTTQSNVSGSELDSLQLNKQELLFFASLKNNLITPTDSIPVIELISNPERVTSNKTMLTHPWNFSAAMGGNLVKGFSLNPIQGIEISKSITPHFEIGTGAYYTYLTVLSDAVKTIVTHTDYSFGYQKNVTEIKTNKLHYVVIPVYVKYNINDKNTFIMGANMFALFTSSNSVSTYKDSDGEKQGLVSKKTSGYSNGINTYDVGLLAGYKRQLFGNLGAALYFNYGLMDIKKNDYYNENKFERNISAQFMLTYKL